MLEYLSFLVAYSVNYLKAGTMAVLFPLNSYHQYIC